jgi:hypothetical protein
LRGRRNELLIMKEMEVKDLESEESGRMKRI